MKIKFDGTMLLTLAGFVLTGLGTLLSQKASDKQAADLIEKLVDERLAGK